MRSCIFLLYIALSGAVCRARRRRRAPSRADPMRSTPTREPRQRAAGRRDLGRASCRRSAGLRVGVEAGARALLARRPRAGAERRTLLEAGVEAGAAAVALQPDQPEGHFWIAANMGALAESFGLRAGLKYRGAIKDELEDRAAARSRVSAGLGRSRARPLVLQGAGALRRQQQEGGRASARVADLQPAQHRVALLPRRDCSSTTGRNAEARAELQKVLAAPIDPEWAPEDGSSRRRRGAAANDQ